MQSLETTVTLIGAALRATGEVDINTPTSQDVIPSSNMVLRLLQGSINHWGTEFAERLNKLASEFSGEDAPVNHRVLGAMLTGLAAEMSMHPNGHQ